MEEKKFEQLNSLYKSLKVLDEDILSKFNCAEINDEEYFSYAIHNDLVSNALNVLVNYLSGNIESVGVANSCRMILEALTILEMNKAGDISVLQKSIYRYSYSYVDLDNYKIVMTGEQQKGKNYQETLSDREKCAGYILQHFGCKYEDIQKRGNGVDDPCFYLKKNLKEKIKFSKLIEKYFSQEKAFARMYEFFSIIIHPRCELNLAKETVVMILQQRYVDAMLALVKNYLSNEKMLFAPPNTNDFNADFLNNPILVNNVHNIKEMEQAFDCAIRELCFLPDQTNMFSWFYLEKSKHLVLDMLTSLSLGYIEHVIAIFKPFIEMFSIFYIINTKDLQEYKCLANAYWCTSKMQFIDYIKKIEVQISDQEYKNEMKELYEQYYKKKYKIHSFEKFYEKCMHNSLYFLDNSKKSFNKFVREATDSLFPDDLQRKTYMFLYKISNDMAHASGYSFNATADFVRVTSFRVVHASIQLIINYLIHAALTVREYDMDVNVKEIIDAMKVIMLCQEEEIQKIYEKTDLK